MSDKTVITDFGPRRVGKYLVTGVLGEGAMGIVYAGHDPDIDRPVAIKTIHKHLVDAAGSDDWLARFAREARAAGRVLHPNLVTIFDYLEIQTRPYLVMEQLAATTLENRLARPDGLDLGEAGHIMSQILDGLACIHAAGIIHRDMKPANVMLTASGGVKLTDFGIARLTSMDKTGAGMVGTPHYMAPEQFSGGDVDARADIYATGVVLYEVLTGVRPFQGGGLEAVLLASKQQAIDPPSARNPNLPKALDAVVLRAIEVEPSARFGSAEQMQAALVAALSGQSAISLDAGNRPTAVAPSPTMLSRMSAATLTEVEQNLVSRIGPIGTVLARKAAATATDAQQMLELLLSELRPGAERDAMSASLQGLLEVGESAGASGLTAADLSRIATTLTQYLGPISSLLIKREAGRTATPEALISALASNIPDDAARATFVAQVSGRTGKGSQTHA